MILKMYSKNNSEDVLQHVVDVLANGGIIIIPTDTIYALACSAMKERAVERICRMKGIDPKKNHLSVVCYDMSEVSRNAKLDNATFKLMKRNLPGPFTFILNASNRLPKIFRGRKEVGIRMPDNGIASEIAARLGSPLMVSSIPQDKGRDIAYTTDPELIYERLGHEVDLVIDGGIGGTEGSTVVDCTSGEPLIVRQGTHELDFG